MSEVESSSSAAIAAISRVEAEAEWARHRRAYVGAQHVALRFVGVCLWQVFRMVVIVAGEKVGGCAAGWVDADGLRNRREWMMSRPLVL